MRDRATVNAVALFYCLGGLYMSINFEQYCKNLEKCPFCGFHNTYFVNEPTLEEPTQLPVTLECGKWGLQWIEVYELVAVKEVS